MCGSQGQGTGEKGKWLLMGNDEHILKSIVVVFALLRERTKTPG